MILLNFNSFSDKLHESDGYSPIDTYKSIAVGVARTYALLWQLVSIGDPTSDTKEKYNAFKVKLANEKDPNKKWILIKVSVGRLQDMLYEIPIKDSIDFNKLSNLAVYAIKSFRHASNILTDDMSSEKIARRLKLIDDAMLTDTVTLTESLIFEKNDEWLPQESDILEHANRISSEIISLRSYAESVTQIYPKSEEYINDAITTYINPIANKVSKILSTPMPDTKLNLSKSVRKMYRNRGWDIENTKDKRMVDMYVKLEDLEDDLIEASTKIRKGIKNINKELQGDSAALEYIDNANSKLDTIEKKIELYLKLRDTDKRSKQIIPIAQDSDFDNRGLPKAIPDAPLVDVDQLRKHLKKKYSVK